MSIYKEDQSSSSSGPPGTSMAMLLPWSNIFKIHQCSEKNSIISLYLVKFCLLHSIGSVINLCNIVQHHVHVIVKPAKSPDNFLVAFHDHPNLLSDTFVNQFCIKKWINQTFENWKVGKKIKWVEGEANQEGETATHPPPFSNNMTSSLYI